MILLNIDALLWAPGDFIYYDGRNLPVFSKKFQVEITPTELPALFKGFIILKNGILLNLKTKKYDPHTVTIPGEGVMPSGTSSCMEKLVADGWIINEEAVRLYDLPRDKRPPPIAT